MVNNKIMTEEEFNRRKKYLLDELAKYIIQEKYKGADMDFILRVQELLQSCTYGNRLQYKGVLGHLIVDQSPDICDYLLSSIVGFDHNM